MGTLRLALVPIFIDPQKPKTALQTVLVMSKSDRPHLYYRKEKRKKSENKTVIFLIVDCIVLTAINYRDMPQTLKERGDVSLIIFLGSDTPVVNFARCLR